MIEHAEAAYGEGTSQFVRLTAPTGDVSLATMVVIVHGGFWKQKYTMDSAAIETLAPALCTLGDNVGAVEIEYRRLGDEGGGWPGSVEDVVAAILHVRLELSKVAPWSRLRDSRLVLLGHSAGGHSALVAAHRLAALGFAPALAVALAPVADLSDAFDRQLSDEGDAVQLFMHGATPVSDPEVYARASPAESMLPLVTPTLLVAAVDDADVPPDYVRRFFHKAKNAATNATAEGNAQHPLHYLELGGADHYAIVDASTDAWATTWRVVAAFLREGAWCE